MAALRSPSHPFPGCRPLPFPCSCSFSPLLCFPFLPLFPSLTMPRNRRARGPPDSPFHPLRCSLPKSGRPSPFRGIGGGAPSGLSPVPSFLSLLMGGFRPRRGTPSFHGKREPTSHIPIPPPQPFWSLSCPFRLPFNWGEAYPSRGVPSLRAVGSAIFCVPRDLPPFPFLFFFGWAAPHPASR